MTHSHSFADGLAQLARQPHAIVVLSLSARGGRLRKQLERIRTSAPQVFLAAVVCHDTDVEDAIAAGADDVMSLERDGDLVCAPVLRWIEMSRAGVGRLIDLQATTRTRAAAKHERDQLRAEVASLSRRVLRDPASNALSREAFVAQLELASKLLARSGETIELLVFELPTLSESWSDDLVGGCMGQIGQTLSEVAGPHAVVGRVAANRFAFFIAGISESDANWLVSVASERMRVVSEPLVGDLGVAAMNARIRCQDLAAPAREVLEEIEDELAHDAYPTRVVRRRAAP